MILRQQIYYLKEFFKDPSMRKVIFWVACLAAFSARFANG
jgi:hypothetical protein